jgi:uncharacterized membrane protein HdeD (DUF308 family)
MNYSNFFGLVRLFAMPVILIVLGALLVLAPDYAAVLATRIISYLLTAVGIGYGIAAFLGSPSRRTVRIITAAFCLILGSALLVNPLILAANIGRVLGIMLAVEGISNLVKHSAAKPTALLTLGAALILVMAPMTASRLVFTLCGLLLLVIGIAQLLERIRRRRLPPEDRDPNIIDALD